jgi:hypothetical protein
VTARPEAGASRQASTDGAGLAATAAAVHPGERRRRLTGETTEGPAERPESTLERDEAAESSPIDAGPVLAKWTVSYR